MPINSESTIRAGDVLPSLTLPETSGGLIKTWDFHGRLNLVMVFLPDPDFQAGRDLFKQLSRIYDEVQAEEAEVLPVIRASLSQAETIKRDLGWRTPVLVDETGDVFRRFGLGEQSMVVIADRYGEICYPDGVPNQGIPSADEILSWLRFIESQCPE